MKRERVARKPRRRTGCYTFRNLATGHYHGTHSFHTKKAAQTWLKRFGMTGGYEVVVCPSGTYTVEGVAGPRVVNPRGKRARKGKGKRAPVSRARKPAKKRRDPFRGKKRSNPGTVYMGRCTRIEYVNAGDNRAYYHDFKGGVSIYANPDGTVVLMGKKPIVGERLV